MCTCVGDSYVVYTLTIDSYVVKKYKTYICIVMIVLHSHKRCRSNRHMTERFIRRLRINNICVRNLHINNVCIINLHINAMRIKLVPPLVRVVPNKSCIK